MYSDVESEEPCNHPSREAHVQQKPSSPPKTTQDKSPNAPENLTAQRNTQITTENVPTALDSGQDKLSANGTQAKHDSGSEVPPGQTEVQSTTLQPSTQPTKATTTLETVPPSTDNSSQVHSRDIACTLCIYVHVHNRLYVVIHVWI